MNPLKSLRSILVVFLAVLLLNSLQPAVRAAAQDNSLPGQFAYVESDARLYLVRGNVEQPVLLVQAGVGESINHPHFSRDGRYLAFCLASSADGDVPDLFYLDTRTLEKIKVTSDGSCSYDWSPDGQTLIFSTPSSLDSPSTQANGIWAYSLQTGEIELLIPSDVAVIDPRWSPDGQTISYFDFCFECVGQFHTYDFNTGAEQEWSHQGTDDYIGPDVDWSPDGQLLVYDKELWMYAPAGETYGLYRSARDGEARQEIHSQPGKGAYFPLWSPDGKRIAFASLESFIIGNYRNVRGDLMTVSADGSDAKKLYSSLYEIFPQGWSPDGRYLLFVEPTSMPRDAAQEQQLVLLEAETGSILWKQPSSGSISADWAPIPETQEISPQAAPKIAGKTGMLFVSPDDALAFHEPISGQTQKLTPSFSGKDFSVSPDGRTVLFGNQIVAVESQADGSVAASITAADHPKEFSLLRWSPDGQTYGFVEDGIIWQADLSGNHTKLGEGSAPPDWSFDGRWMAFCDRQGRLWIAETGKPADWIVQQEECQVRWSPSQSILAYVTFPVHDLTDWASGTAFLYDPLSGSTKEVGQKVSEVGWSPDGKLVSLQRISWMGASNYGFSLSAVNPESGQELLIEEFDAEAAGNHGWNDQTDGYIVGKYKFQADLLNKEQLAEILFDATRDGTSLLVGSENAQGIQVGCRDVETTAYFPIADVVVKNRPGVYAEFSPDGTDILVSNDAIEKTTDWIAGCGGGTPEQFDTLALPYQQYFSTGSSWLVMEQTDVFGEQNAKIVLRELNSGQLQEVPAGLQTSSAWFQMPEAPVVPSTPNTLDIVAAASPVPGSTAYPAPLQGGAVDNRVVMFSLLLWAGALIAIVILMLYLWRNWSIPPSPVKPTSAEPPLEEKIAPAAEIASEPSQEELDRDFQNGVELVRAGKASEGIAALTRVIRSEPENNIAWFWLGIAAARQKDVRSAERCFLQAKRHGHPEADKALEWLKKQI